MEMCKNFASGVTSVITGAGLNNVPHGDCNGFVINVVNVDVFIYS